MASARILVADDRPDDASLLVDILSTAQYQVITAADGEEALSKARSERPELVILDIHMPRMDGLEVCHRIKSDPEMKGTPVMLLTSTYRDPTDKVRGYEAGADDYVTQPVSHKELIARVAAVLRVRALYDEHVRQEQELERLMSDLQATNTALVTANEELSRLSFTDPLTGALTRQYFFERLNAEMARARRFRQPLAVLRIDVAGMRGWNERLGPSTGDAVLCAMASELKRLIRGIDILGRVGGDEFALVLPETGAAGTKLLAERIGENLVSITFLLNKDVRVVVNQGAAVLESDSAETADALMERAALALEHAQLQGPGSILIGP